MKPTLLLLLTCVLYVTSEDESQEDKPEEGVYLDDGVDTPSGRILGLDSKFFGVRAKTYLGVPYARPPLGGLRFKRPEQPPPREGLFVADTMPPACVQYSQYNFPWYDNEDGKSEDCLYLNIWSPRFSASSGKKLPVIFWIHGGGFTVGSNRIRAQSGLGLAVLGSSIVVAPNYRLGALGFFSSGDDDAPGNAGLHDLLLALQWTRANIEAFGGDLDKLTIMGQGSGSIIVGLFLLSPLTQGLYTRAIMQSGAPTSLPADPAVHNEELGQRLADALGCLPENQTLKDDATVQCLREVKASRIARVLSAFNPTSTTSFIPVYGDEFLPRDPSLDLKEGRFSTVPLLIGTNKDEGAHLLTGRQPELFGVFGHKDPIISKEQGASILRETFSDLLPPSNGDPEEVVRQYLDDVDDDDSKEVRRQVYRAMGDYETTCPSMYFAEQYSTGNNTMQFYVFAQRPNTSAFAPWMGSTQWSEVPYVMGRYLGPYNYFTFIENYNGVLGLTDALTRIWGDFANEGSGFKNWKNYSSTHHQYILLKYNVMRKMRGPGPHLDNCDFFRPYYQH